jgi:hypothetical protein
MPSVQRGPGFHGGTPPTHQGNRWERADTSSAHECRQTTALPGTIGGNIVRICVEIARFGHEREQERRIPSVDHSRGNDRSHRVADRWDFEAGNRSRIRTVSLRVCAPRQHGWRWTAGGWPLSNWPAGLLRVRLVIAGQLGHFPHESSANALLAEIRRVRSSNITRRYLDRVLRSLAVLPPHLIKSGLEVLAEDTSFSPKMRAKFRNCRERIGFVRAQKNVSAGGTDAP